MDGSGTHSASRVFTVAGFLADEDTWLDFDAKWNAILDNPKWPSRLSEFHMVDCVHGDKEFNEGRWSFAQRLYLYGELCALLQGCKVTPIASSVIAGAFQEISSEDLALLSGERTRLGTPLDVCFHGILQQTIRRVHENGETMAVVFDEESKDTQAKFADFCYHYADSFHLGDVFSGQGFADSRKFTPLQAADLLAYGTYQLSHLWFAPPKSEPYFPVIPALWNMLTRFADAADTSPVGTIIDAAGLRNLADKVKRGETLPRKEQK
jgi:Protein of unknown function (DUF3800)